MAESSAPTPEGNPQGDTNLVPGDQGPGHDGNGGTNLPIATPEGEQADKVTLSLEDPTVPGENAEVQFYQSTGDAGLDVALQFVGGLGFGASHPAIQAATKGDFSPLKAALGKMGSRAAGYEPYITVAEDYANRAQAKQQESNQASEKAVLDAVGGAANWQHIQKWAAENADPAEKVQINAAFKAGPLVAAAMAKQIADAYKQSGKSAISPERGVQASASGGPTGTSPMDSAGYKAELIKLQAKHGWNVGNTPEYKALQQRRKAHQG